MKRKKVLLLLIFGSVFLFWIIRGYSHQIPYDSIAIDPFPIFNVTEVRANDLIERSHITITSNAEFTSFGFPGTGTSNDPFLIEGFNLTSTSKVLISITQVSAYFIISNNILNGLNSTAVAISLLFSFSINDLFSCKSKNLFLKWWIYLMSLSE